MPTWLAAVALLLLVSCHPFFLVESLGGNEDLYCILGVVRTATTKEIKAAYRKKALATHPDKIRHVPPQEAAEAFHKVVHAFEILSDEKSRELYDQTGNVDGPPLQQGGWDGSHQQGGGGFQLREHHTFWYDTGYGFDGPIKNSFEVKEAMSRVIHVISLQQLKTIMSDEIDQLERNLLMIFVTPQQVETICDQFLLFPYPFAAMSTQGIWWEDLIQAVKVRYYQENEITKFFGIPHGDNLRSPIVVFGKRRQILDAEVAKRMERIETRNRAELEDWIWQRIQITVWFVNQHTHAVEIFWIHKGSAEMTLTLDPGQRESHNTMLSHEWWIRDSRVDTFPESPRRNRLTKESLLGIWKIVSDEDGQEIIIQSKACVDMSGHCERWEKTSRDCTNNPTFMKVNCRKTCSFCVDKDDINSVERGDRRSRADDDDKDKNKTFSQAYPEQGKDGNDEL